MWVGGFIFYFILEVGEIWIKGVGVVVFLRGVRIDYHVLTCDDIC